MRPPPGGDSQYTVNETPPGSDSQYTVNETPPGGDSQYTVNETPPGGDLTKWIDFTQIDDSYLQIFEKIDTRFSEELFKSNNINSLVDEGCKRVFYIKNCHLIEFLLKKLKNTQIIQNVELSDVSNSISKYDDPDQYTRGGPFHVHLSDVKLKQIFYYVRITIIY
eukprot:GHVL01040103.1.p1 GENE.GHVL01040103.1~~GHVL01040103.1.p1  ORF type:complete len:165 (+),score=54.89 GHVL01040103.1:86-580(+)